MKRIWKFEFVITDEQTVSMPIGAKILHVQVQDHMPYIWALCNPKASYESRTFRVYGTGNPVPEDSGKHIGTFQDGRYIWHLFEV